MKSACWILALASVAISGCGSSGGSEEKLTPAEDRLVNIGQAYANARNNLGRPPKNLEEIRSYFEASPDDVTRSPNDGEEFVILWGTDSNVPPQLQSSGIVAAYEKNGTGGKRNVLLFPLRVIAMTDEELAKCSFAQGYKPPQ